MRHGLGVAPPALPRSRAAPGRRAPASGQAASQARRRRRRLGSSLDERYTEARGRARPADARLLRRALRVARARPTSWSVRHAPVSRRRAQVGAATVVHRALRVLRAGLRVALAEV